MSERLNHADPIKETLDRLAELLSELKRKMGTSSYLDEAIRLLQADRDTLSKRLQTRALLLRIAKIFLTNRPIGARLNKEMHQTGGVYADLTPLKFDFQQIQNPMRFLGSSARIEKEIEPRRYGC